MSFQESIIIPLSMFEKCKFKEEVNPEEDILNNESMPSDLKMKLLQQERKLKPKKKLQPRKELSLIDESDKKIHPDNKLYNEQIQYILGKISRKHQPFISSILHYIKDYSNQISWNKDFDIIIDKLLVNNTNIIDILKLLTKDLIVTADTDIPLGSRKFYDKLIDIGIPKSWIRFSFKRTSSRIANLQSGTGLTWVSL
jgi:hypothetical protein